MRTEATRDEWKQLYELAVRFQEQKPWEWLTSKDLLAISFFLQNKAETAYLSISGNDGYSYGVSMYLGSSGLNSLIGLWEGESLEIDPKYLLAGQNSISLVLSEEEGVPPKQAALLAELGLHFEADGWIYFERYEPGYSPYSLDRDEVQYAIQCLTGLLEALAQYPKQAPKTCQTPEALYHYHYAGKPDKKKGNGDFEALPQQHFQLPSYEITDSKLLWTLQNTKQTSEVWEMEYCPFSKGRTEEGYEKPVRPWAFLLANRTERLPLTHSLVLPKEASGAASKRLSEMILELGRPRELLVPNALVRSQVTELCNLCGIQLSIRDIPSCWKRLAELEKESETDRNSPEDAETQTFFARLSFQEQALQSRQQKIQAVKDFFGQGSLHGKEYEAIEKSIETAWSSREWKDLVQESTRSKLIELLSCLNRTVSDTASREELAELYVRETKDFFFTLGKLLDQDACNTLSLLYEDIHMDDTDHHSRYYYWHFDPNAEINQRGWPIDEFYYSAEQILQLLDRNLLDVGLLTREQDWVLVLKLFPELDSLLKHVLRW